MRAVSRKSMRCGSPAEAGMTLLEILFSIVLVGLVASGISMNMISALRATKLTEVHYAASNLAVSKMEELAAQDALDLDDADDTDESGLQVTGLELSFLRTTNVTVNADDSRTVSVKVTCSNANYPVEVKFETRFALWE